MGVFDKPYANFFSKEKLSLKILTLCIYLNISRVLIFKKQNHTHKTNSSSENRSSMRLLGALASQHGDYLICLTLLASAFVYEKHHQFSMWIITWQITTYSLVPQSNFWILIKNQVFCKCILCAYKH